MKRTLSESFCSLCSCCSTKTCRWSGDRWSS